MSGNSGSSMRLALAFVLVMLVGAACGGSDDEPVSGSGDPVEDDSTENETGENDTDGDDEAGGGSNGAIDEAPPSGQATASVDGLDFSFDLPGALDCSISDESLTYSFRIGDNEVTLGGGVNRTDGGWMGSIALTVYEPPSGELGPVAYYPAPGENGVMDESLFTIDGSTARYEGPMLKQPANDGSLPPPVDAGTGTIIASC